MEDVLVARIGKAHGLKGEVTVQVHTDSPEDRFVPGAVFATDPASAGPLTLRAAKVHNGIQLLAFEGAMDRTAAEGLRGIRLLGSPSERDDDEDGWYEDDLIGLKVQLEDGEQVGTVTALHSRPVQDLLEVEKTDGGTAYIPFVEEIVPDVDIDKGVVTITPPAGLLDLES